MLYSTIIENAKAAQDRELIGRLQSLALQYGEFKLDMQNPEGIVEQDMLDLLKHRFPNAVSILVGPGGIVVNLRD